MIFSSTPFPASTLSQAFRSLTLQTKRTFSTRIPLGRDTRLPECIPEYPYGPHLRFKQAASGLYGGSMIQFGNKISKGRNKGKTRRYWRPNIRREKLYSEALGQHLDLKVQHRVLRTIQKVGGLDQYLLGDTPARIKELGTFGWKLRYQVIQATKTKKEFEKERKQLGMPRKPENYLQFRERYLAEKNQVADPTATQESAV